MKRFRLDKKYIVMLSGALLALILVIVASYYFLYKNVRENVKNSMGKEVTDLSASIENMLGKSTDAIRTCAYEISMMLEREVPDERILGYLGERTESYKRAINSDFTGFYGLINGTFMDGLSWVPDEGYVAEERDWYIRAMEEPGKVVLVSPYYDLYSHTIIISVSRTLADKESVVSMDLSLDSIQKTMEEKAVEYDWKYAILLDPSGFVAASSISTEIGKDYGAEIGTYGRALLSRLYDVDDNESCFLFNYGKRHEVLFVKKTGDGWYMVAARDQLHVLGEVNGLLAVLVGVFLIDTIALAVVMHRVRARQVGMEELVRRVHSVAGMYRSLHLLDFDTEILYNVVTDSEKIELLPTEGGEHAQNALRVYMDNITDERFKEGIFKFIDLSTLNKRMKNKKMITKEFIDHDNLRCRGRFVEIDRREDSSLKTVLWLVENEQEREISG